MEGISSSIGIYGKRLIKKREFFSLIQNYFLAKSAAPNLASVIPVRETRGRHLRISSVINRLSQGFHRACPLAHFGNAKIPTILSAIPTRECSTCRQPSSENEIHRALINQGGFDGINGIETDICGIPEMDRKVIPSIPSKSARHSLIAAMVSAMPFSSRSRAAVTS